MLNFDFNGAAALVGSIGVLIIGVGGFVVSSIRQLRNDVRDDNEQLRHEVKQTRVDLKETHDLVNGVATKLENKEQEVTEAKVDLARLKGEKDGQEAERADPKISATVPGETELTKPKTRETSKPARKHK